MQNARAKHTEQRCASDFEILTHVSKMESANFRCDDLVPLWSTEWPIHRLTSSKDTVPPLGLATQLWCLVQSFS